MTAAALPPAGRHRVREGERWWPAAAWVTRGYLDAAGNSTEDAAAAVGVMESYEDEAGGWVACVEGQVESGAGRA